MVRNVVDAGKATLEAHTKECLGSFDNNINDFSYKGSSIRCTIRAKLLKNRIVSLFSDSGCELYQQ